jgi:hypothetical protein
MTLSDNEAKMEMVLPLLVTDAMQLLESRGQHPEADFANKARLAILKLIDDYPNLENDIWSDKKQEILEKMCEFIDL